MMMERLITRRFSLSAKILHRCVTTKIERFLTRSSEAKEKLIPYTSELVSSRGRPLENIAVGYHLQKPVNSSGQRRVDDGFLELMLPFSKNDELRDAMIRSDGRSIRYGKLFEVLDSLAADVCYRHLGFADLPDNDKYLVTASVDGATTSARIDPSQDLKLQAYLTYVGRSSMECQIDIISGDTKVGDTHFIMAARYKKGGAAPVYGLCIPPTDLEALEKFNRGQLRAAARRTKALSSLDKIPPTAEEVAVMHKLFLDSNQVKLQKAAIIEAYLSLDDNGSGRGSGRSTVSSGSDDNDSSSTDSEISMSSSAQDKDELSIKIRQEFKSRRNFKWMRNLTFRNTFFMNPQERNIHGNIFGGYLMREAFELAWVSALCFFDGATPSFKFVDDIQFLHPVPVGSVMEFNSSIVFSQDAFVVVQVEAFKLNPHTSYRSKTNELNYVFRAPKAVSKVKEVMPSTYGEFVLYLEGRRSLNVFLKSMEMDGLPVT